MVHGLWTMDAYNFDIDPEINMIKKALFSAQGLPGLLSKYQLKIV